MNGQKVKHTYEEFDEGLRIKIGSKDKKITQLKNIYEITYTTIKFSDGQPITSE